MGRKALTLGSIKRLTTDEGKTGIAQARPVGPGCIAAGKGLCTGVFSSARIVPDRFRHREPIRAFETFERGPLNVVIIYRLFENLPAAAMTISLGARWGVAAA
jgi:hypothetical protein